MKKYLAFAYYDEYQPQGGAGDYIGTFDSELDAIGAIEILQVYSGSVALWDGDTLHCYLKGWRIRRTNSGPWEWKEDK